uniref:Uncharacterized protein n=1 Tax=Rhizophora mucronata TaxID=61149 RepID=A0A2P2Q6D5_RHIMU
MPKRDVEIDFIQNMIRRAELVFCKFMLLSIEFSTLQWHAMTS